MASLRILVAFAALSAAAGAHGQSLDLSRVPPSINAALPPNIIVTLDDSGSMGWGYMPDNANFTDCRYYDHRVNRIYFNPAVTYDPPLRPDLTQFPNASINNAWVDGFLPTIGTRNLLNSFATSTATKSSLTNNPSFTWRTSHSPTTGSNNGRAFYCEGYTVRYVADMSPADQTNFANWFSYYRTRSLAARSAMATAFARLDPKARVAWQNLITNNFGTGTITRALEVPAWRTNFFENWLYRAPYSGVTPTRASLIRAGNYLENNRANSETNPYFDVGYGRELSCRQSFHVMITDGYTNESSLSNPNGIGNEDAAGSAIEGGRTLSGDKAQLYWRQNATSGNLSPRTPDMADIAMYYWKRDLRPGLANEVPPYFGDNSINQVSAGNNEEEIWFNPANDPGTWQRMVNFFVTFGVGGTLGFDTTPACVNNPAINSNTICKSARLMRLRRGLDTWPGVNNNAATSIDDTWHAAVNSRGDFLSAEDPQELVNSLSSLFDNINRRQAVTGSAGSTAFLRSDTVLFQASYNSGDWTGNIEGFEIDPVTGQQTANPAWTSSAAAQLDARSPASRRILTNTAGSGAATAVDFAWGNLTSAQQLALNTNPVYGNNDGLGERRLQWIRGVRSFEQSNGGALRNRLSILGPFIGSSLINVAAPRFGYRGRSDFAEGGTQYARFRQDNRDRPPTLYIGSNDGMLHAFDADTGAERWAYIPNRVFPNLARLTVPEYQFVPFVNNTPIDHDVFIGGRWRTVLVGTLGLGGQGVYAIDITDPESPSVLWEFTDQADVRLGYTYGRPNVVRLSDGTWVALVPSGYNSESTVDFATRGLPNERPDTFANTGGNSTGAVFAINIANGAYRRIDVPLARGLATVQAADYELDYEVDFVVAGDLNGDLWRIDLEGRGWSELASAPVEVLFRGNRVTGVPQRPITTAPTIYADPATGKMVVVVGTGKYIENGDREINIPRQAIYGIRECGRGCDRYPITEASLVQQTLSVGPTGFLNMAQTNVVPPDRNGWFVQVGDPGLLGGALRGERIIEMSIPVSFPSGIVAIGSFIPSNDPCAPLGTGAVYVLSAFTGGFPLPGDLNPLGTAYSAGQAIFDGGGAGSVGMVTNRPPDLSAFLDPDGGAMSLMGQKIMGVPVRRRSGWREIPLE